MLEQLQIKLRRYAHEIEYECFVKIGRKVTGPPRRFQSPREVVAWVAAKLGLETADVTEAAERPEERAPDRSDEAAEARRLLT